MFLLTALLYPCLLAALSLGSGLLLERLCGGFTPAALLPALGLAGLIALSQLSTYAYPLAPATPYLMAAVALAGFLAGRRRALALARAVAARPWQPLLPVLAYAIALAPVLLAGRASLSSYMTLADSAVHLIGADYLIHHGQHYAHLDLRNSYGQFIRNYYATSYPSGADTLFGGSGLALGVPLIWAFQPFNAFLLASAVGPAWLILRRMGLRGAWAAVGALTCVVPAVVYAYELFASVKEIACVPLILSLGCLVLAHGDWLRGPARRGVPFALLLAGGVSALGVAFGAWALAAAAVLAPMLARDLLARPRAAARSLGPIALGAITLLIAAWPTWAGVSASIHVAQDIASTSNSGNLHSPLRAIQVFGVWLGGSYKLQPAGFALGATHVLVALTLLAALLGAVQLLRARSYALAGWIALMLAAWLAVALSTTVWASAKALMLSSPVVLLLAWVGVAGLRAASSRALSVLLAGLLALALAGGVLVSDALQYHVSNLAPTARYEELGSLNSRWRGHGPVLVTDFDEYSMYELRDVDVGGPDFVYPPPALAAAAGGYGRPVELDRVPAAALRAYPLVLTRRDPRAPRPPAAYRLAWQGVYYQLWQRTPGAPAAAAHVALSGSPAAECRAIARLAAHGSMSGSRLVGAQAPLVVAVSLARARHPARWGHERQGLVMSSPGRLSASFSLPAGGTWEVWVQGQIMPSVELGVDGRPRASIAAQLSGNSLVPDAVPPIAVRLRAGEHTLTVTRSAAGLAPGDGGAAVLEAVFLTHPGASPARLRSSPRSDPAGLCGRRYQWVELTSS